MAATSRSLGRMVLALPHSLLDYPAVEVATELAEGLGMQCLGAFIVEPAISSLSARSGAQEFRSTAMGWQPVDHDSLVREADELADSVRRKFAALARYCGTDALFQLVHAVSDQGLTSLAGRDDIVVMIEPRHPADRITYQFRNVLRAAFESSFSVMLVPSRVRRRRGPVVAVATMPNDLAVDVAADVAGRMGEPLLVVNATGVPIDRSTPGAEQRARIIASPSQSLPIERRVLADLGNVGERLIVVRRDNVDEAGLRVMSDRRGVPILVVDSG